MDADSLAAAVHAKVDDLQARLLAKVDANLSGGALHSRTGTLKASIVGDVTATTDVIRANVASVGVPYAAIQEYGGQTAPHDIVPVKAQALDFAGVGGDVFARTEPKG